MQGFRKYVVSTGEGREQRSTARAQPIYETRSLSHRQGWRLVHSLTDCLTKRLTHRLTNQPSNRPTVQPTVCLTDRLSDQSTDCLTVPPIDQPADRSSDRPTNRLTVRPTVRATIEVDTVTTGVWGMGWWVQASYRRRQSMGVRAKWILAVLGNVEYEFINAYQHQYKCIQIQMMQHKPAIHKSM